jgi:hypothetical protein
VSFDLDNYNSVPERMTEFFQKYPEGSLKQVKYELVMAGDKLFVVYTAAAYRTPDDGAPGEGTAWEAVPGKTPYTRDSEMQNAETSAWGRAILAIGAADTRKGIASREEVQNRRGAPDDNDEPDPAVTAAIEAADTARGSLLAKTEEYGWDENKLVKRYWDDYRKNLRNTHDVEMIAGFGDALVAEAKAQDAETPVAAQPTLDEAAK